MQTVRQKKKLQLRKSRNPFSAFMSALRGSGAMGNHGDKKKYSRKEKHNKSYVNI